MWLIYGIITALCESSKDLLGKRYATAGDEYAAAFGAVLYSVFLLLPAIAYYSAHLMLAVCVIWSFGAHFSKLMVHGSSPLFATFSATLVGAVTLTVIFKLRSTVSLLQVLNPRSGYCLLGIVKSFSDLSLYLALSSGLTASVISLKRTNIVWSSIAGQHFYNEQLSPMRITGILIIMLGVIALGLS